MLAKLERNCTPCQKRRAALKRGVVRVQTEAKRVWRVVAGRIVEVAPPSSGDREP